MIAKLLQGLKAQRDALAENLTAMGVKADKTEKLNTLVRKVLQITGGSETLFDADNILEHTEDIALFLNDGYYLLSDFIAKYPNFVSGGLNYNQTDFGWDTPITTILLRRESISGLTEIAVTYQSGATENGDWIVYG